jgi:hypothetical protein
MFKSGEIMDRNRIYWVMYHRWNGEPWIFSKRLYWLTWGAVWLSMLIMVGSLPLLLLSAQTVLMSALVTMVVFFCWAASFFYGRAQAEKNRARFEALLLKRDRENDESY